MHRVLLFDIDNTLLYSGGAGGFAMDLVFQEMFDIQDGFGKIEFSGRTDRFILKSALDAHGIDGDFESHMDAFLQRYYAVLPQTLAEKNGTLMPGFPQLLALLQRNDSVRLGLATGNFSEAARQKLSHYEIDAFFLRNGRLSGGFGEESLDRADVVETAISSVADSANPGDVLVIGDTPKDITAALDNGVIAVGVATGSYTSDQLRDSGAQLVFEDFADWERAATLLANGTD